MCFNSDRNEPRRPALICSPSPRLTFTARAPGEEEGQGFCVQYLPPMPLMTIFKSVSAFLMNAAKRAWAEELGRALPLPGAVCGSGTEHLRWPCFIPHAGFLLAKLWKMPQSLR